MKSGNDISIAASLLNKGEVVAIPTETVYGLAANAYNPDAVIKIFNIKKRPRFNPLIVHIASIGHLDQAAGFIHPELKKIALAFWPGPLTILANKAARIHDLVTAGGDLVAVRVPDHSLTLELLNKLDFPLAAPSANEFGRVSPTSAEHVIAQLGERIPYVLDGGDSSVGVESTIIKIENNKVVILRPGGISPERIGEITGYIPEIATSNTIEAPGMLKSHYSPGIPLLVGDFASNAADQSFSKIAALNFKEIKVHPAIIAQRTLSPSGDLSEAARNLFSGLHDLEKSGADVIIADVFPDQGIGIAINDRLKRASS